MAVFRRLASNTSEMHGVIMSFGDHLKTFQLPTEAITQQRSGLESSQRSNHCRTHCLH